VSDSLHRRVKSYENPYLWDHSSKIPIHSEALTGHAEQIYEEEISRTPNIASTRSSGVTNYTRCSRCGISGPSP